MLETESLTQPYVFTDLRQLLIHTNTKAQTHRHTITHEAYIHYVQFHIWYSADAQNTVTQTQNIKKEVNGKRKRNLVCRDEGIDD